MSPKKILRIEPSLRRPRRARTEARHGSGGGSAHACSAPRSLLPSNAAFTRRLRREGDNVCLDVGSLLTVEHDMRSRQVLQAGAALVAVPLTGCGANTPEPQPAPAASDPIAPSASAKADPTPAPTASNDAPQAAPSAAPDADKPAAPKTNFTRTI